MKNSRKYVLYDFLDYKISEDVILVPDILVVCGEIKKKYLNFPPVLVAEVLSPSTALRDRHTKYSFYEQEGIRYYLIVDVDNKKVEVFLLIDGKYVLQQPSGNSTYNFTFGENCSGDVSFNEIW